MAQYSHEKGETGEIKLSLNGQDLFHLELKILTNEEGEVIIEPRWEVQGLGLGLGLGLRLRSGLDMRCMPSHDTVQWTTRLSRVSSHVRKVKPAR